MKHDYTGDQSNMKSNNYGGYSNNYGNAQYYNHGSYRYGGSPGAGNYGNLVMVRMGTLAKNRDRKEHLRLYFLNS